MISALTACRGRRRLLQVVLIFLLTVLSVTALHAQCNPPVLDFDALPRRVTSRPVGEELLPENSHLASATYTSDFFGFSFDLPLPVRNHLIMLPLMPPRQHALLALAYEDGNQHGTFTVAAIDPRPGLEPPSAEQQKRQLRNWGSFGNSPYEPPTRAPLPDDMLHSGRFSFLLRHKHDTYTAIFSTRIRSYNVKVLVTSTQKDFIERAKQLIAEAHFYCTQGDGTLETSDGKVVKPQGAPYEGPAVPTARADAAIRDRPALQGIPLGGFSRGVYRNPDLGLQYDIPTGWAVLPTENSVDPPTNATAQREQEFLHACSKTLLRLASPPADDPTAPPQRMIILRALDPTCLSLRTPASTTDNQTAADVGSSLEVLSEFGEISSHELLSLSDHLFVLFHGTIGSRVPGQDLASRMSQSIYLTRHNKMLLVWSLIAPTSTDLNAMPSTRIAFDNAPPFELRPTVTAKVR